MSIRPLILVCLLTASGAVRNTCAKRDLRPASSAKTNGVWICTQRSVGHSYAVIANDGRNHEDTSCFGHLNEDGSFKVGSKEKYALAFCPFSKESVDDTFRRRLLFEWYQMMAKNVEEFGHAPFAVNDIAMSCLVGDINDKAFPFAFIDGFSTKETGVPTEVKEVLREGLTDNQFYCDTFLSLAVMFDVIGFRLPGIVLDGVMGARNGFRSVRTVATYHGHETGIESSTGGWGVMINATVLKSQECTFFESKYPRLVLRAVLPTYFRLVYPQSEKGMFIKGARFFQCGNTWEKVFEKQLELIREAALRHENAQTNVDAAFSLAKLRGEDKSRYFPYISSFVNNERMEANTNKECKGRRSVLACNYSPTKADHVGVHGVCKEDECFNPTTGSCFVAETEDDLEKCRSGENVKKRSCPCAKAICWHWTCDLRGAVKASQKIFEGYEPEVNAETNAAALNKV